MEDTDRKTIITKTITLTQENHMQQWERLKAKGFSATAIFLIGLEQLDKETA